MFKKMKFLNQVVPYLVVIFSAFLFAFSVRSFVNKSGLLTGGFSGIALILSRYIASVYYGVGIEELLADGEKIHLVNTLTSVFFFSLNIPLIILAFRKLGKRFAILSTLYIVSLTVFIKVLPEAMMDIFHLGAENEIANALFAGVLSGLAIAFALNVGGSTGGMEIIGTYFSRKKQVTVGKMSTILNAIVITCGGILFQQWTLILYTLVLVFVTGRVVDTIHRFTKKVMVQVVTNLGEEISNAISLETNYNSTILDARGGYTNQARNMIIIIVPETKVGAIVDLIRSLDPCAFITTLEVANVYGNFYVEPLK